MSTRKRIRQLELENQQLRQDVTILKKASAGSTGHRNSSVFAVLPNRFCVRRALICGQRLWQAIKATAAADWSPPWPAMVPHRAVRRLMRQAALKPVWKRKFVHTADSKHGLPVVAANVLNRQFNPSAPNLAYVSDITYIRTGAGWLYLATVLDLCARKVVGLGHGAGHTRHAGLRGLEHGHSTAPAGARIDRSFGPGQSMPASFTKTC